jgi:hypothetical protein
MDNLWSNTRKLKYAADESSPVYLAQTGALRSTQPPVQWVSGTISSEVKWSGREADHPSPTNADVKKTSVYTSTPPYAFKA